jgi:hypothetical protein
LYGFLELGFKGRSGNMELRASWSLDLFPVWVESGWVQREAMARIWRDGPAIPKGDEPSGTF